MDQDNRIEIIESLSERKGDEWVEEQREFLIAQSRVIGVVLSEEL